MSIFKGKRAVVTGSGTGLGAATILRLAKEGARVAVHYRESKKEAQKTEAACKKLGAETLLVQGDVASDSDCRKIVEDVAAKWGGVDILVNNSGTTKFAAHEDLEALSAEDFLWIYKVNMVGAYQMTRAVAPHMKKAGMGSIVNVSSIAGVTGVGSSIAYAASKGALNTLTLSLARALAPEIRVNAVCPGFIGTRWFRERLGEEIFANLVAQQEKDMPLKQAGTAELVSDAVVFFCGEGARHMTGQFLIPDAGMHLNMNPLLGR